jgi:hypothetical protein
MLAGIAEAARRGLAVSLTTDRTLRWNAPFYARLGFVLLKDAAVPPDLQARLDSQVAAGFDPAQRCAMMIRLEDAR